MPDAFSTGCVDCQINALATLVDIVPGQIVEKKLVENDEMVVILFAMAEGQEIPEHAAPGTAIVTCMAGTGKVTVDGVEHVIHNGGQVTIESNVPHSVLAVHDFKMMLEVSF